MSKAEENPTLTELDCSNAGRGVWLVKVPKYVAKKWLKGKISSRREISLFYSISDDESIKFISFH